MNPLWGRKTLYDVAHLSAIATIAAAAAAVGAAASAAGSISSGMAQQSAERYNAQVDQNNATQAQEAADAQSQVSEQQTASKLAQQKVDYAASGVDPNTGTPVDVMTDTASKGRLDALSLRYGGQVRAQADREGGSLALYQGASDADAGYLTGAGTLLTGASKLQSAIGSSAPSTPSGSSAAPSAGSGNANFPIGSGF